MAMSPSSHPVLTPEETGALEGRLLGDDERRIAEAMGRAGTAVAEAALADLEEAGGFPADGRLLVLVGKGSNGGDALIAARVVLARHPAATACVVFAFGEQALRPRPRRAWQALVEAGGARVSGATAVPGGAWDLCLDGVFGYGFKPPLAPAAAVVLRAANAAPVRLRAAVDLPSGLDDADGFAADFSYATGVVKTTLLSASRAGRPRYLDLGFLGDGGRAAPAGGPAGAADSVGDAATDRILLPSILAGLAGLRPAGGDKRSQGHVLVVAGSRDFPGAALMGVMSALRGGAGLVTGLVPGALVPAFASRVPEAMWRAMPEGPGGGLGAGGLGLVAGLWDRADALVIGSGLGREPATLALAAQIVADCPCPVVVDADALQPGIVRGRRRPGLVLTPHAGEYARIAGGGGRGSGPAAPVPVPHADLARELGAVLVLKGAVTRVCDGGPTYHAFAGGPVLARGGSGDILAGLLGGLLARDPGNPLASACRAVLWQGLAADRWARARGQTAVCSTEVLDFLATALRECAPWRRIPAS